MNYSRKISSVLLKLLLFLIVPAVITTSVFSVKYIEGLVAIVVFFLICVVSGLYIKIKIPKENYMLKATGWGLLYGALAALVIVGSIMAWFYFYYFEKN